MAKFVLGIIFYMLVSVDTKADTVHLTNGSIIINCEVKDTLGNYLRIKTTSGDRKIILNLVQRIELSTYDPNAPTETVANINPERKAGVKAKTYNNVKVIFNNDSTTFVTVTSELDLPLIPKNYTQLQTNDQSAYEIILPLSKKIKFVKTLLDKNDPNYESEMKAKIILVETTYKVTEHDYAQLDPFKARSWKEFSYDFKVGNSELFDAGYSGGNLALYLQEDAVAMKELSEFKLKRNMLIYGVGCAFASFGIAALNGMTEGEEFTTYNPKTEEFEKSRTIKTSSAVIIISGFIAACYGYYSYTNSSEHIFKAVEIYNNNLDK